MTRLFVAIFLIFSSTAFASATRIINADTIKSGSGSVTWTPPATSTTLVGTVDTAVLSNKTIDGSLNILSKLPVSSQMVVDSGSGNGTVTAFTLSQAPPTSSGVDVYLNGILQEYTTDYTISSTTLTFTTAPATGQTIRAVYSRY